MLILIFSGALTSAFFLISEFPWLALALGVFGGACFGFDLGEFVGRAVGRSELKR